ncbi:DUF3105 domain-containing protein [Haloechinothrix halophila]|uniref:DUF3105 domain-containing protein n=1 Tax=Haloechinothrix halophila TaxID=1069073 RepID=UPI000428F5E7|nr:DUF3105 domain-containing protein [Haloechinothrix halophila]
MASGTKKKGKGGVSDLRAATDAVNKRQVPWGTLIAVVAIVALAAVVFGYYIIESAPKREQEAREEAAASFQPSAQNPDPSKDIEGVEITEIKAAGHVKRNQRVAYDVEPPMGGPHEDVWADCNGTVYPEGVRTENMVHTMEHGAVWITYNPDKLDSEAVDLLKLRVENKPYTVMSPYPGMDSPISLQAWGHQLKVDSAEDERIDQFIAALRRNPNVAPEPQGGCSSQPGMFDVDNPPPFNPEEPGKDAVPMDYNAGGPMAGQPGAGQPVPGAGDAGDGDKAPADE